MTNSTQDRTFLTILMAAVFVVSAHGGTILSGSAYRGMLGASFSISGSDFGYSGQMPGPPYNLGPCIVACTAPGSYSFSDSMFALSGDYMANGVVYAYNCNSEVYACYGGIHFSGVLTLPDLGASLPSTITVTAPFAASGSFSGMWHSSPPIDFQGTGIATITLIETAPATYGFSSVRYAFVDTPEPATVGLVGLTLLALGLRRARNQSRL